MKNSPILNLNLCSTQKTQSQKSKNNSNPSFAREDLVILRIPRNETPVLFMSYLDLWQTWEHLLFGVKSKSVQKRPDKSLITWGKQNKHRSIISSVKYFGECFEKVYGKTFEENGRAQKVVSFKPGRFCKLQSRTNTQ